MRFRTLLAITSLALLLSADAVRADYAYDFASSTANGNSGTFTNNFTVASGQSITIYVYLTQTGTGTYNGLNSTGMSQRSECGRVLSSTLNRRLADASAPT